MIREQCTVVIERPIEDVFAYLTDVTRFPEWSSALQKAVLISEPPLREGSVVRETVKMLGRHVDTEMEVTELKDEPLSLAEASPVRSG